MFVSVRNEMFFFLSRAITRGRGTPGGGGGGRCRMYKDNRVGGTLRARAPAGILCRIHWCVPQVEEYSSLGQMHGHGLAAGVCCGITA